MLSSDQISLWSRDSRLAFEAWILSMKGRGLSKNAKQETIKIYRVRWGQFDQYLRDHRLNIYEVRPQHIGEFLSQKARMLCDKKSSYEQDELNQIEQLLCYRRLIEKVYEFVIDTCPDNISKNPAELSNQEGKEWTGAIKSDGRDFLSEPELEILEQHLEYIAQKPFESLRTLAEIREFRRYVTTALMIGAGLKSSEILTLKISDIHIRSGQISLHREDTPFHRKINLKDVSYLYVLLENWLTYWHSYFEQPQPREKLLFPAMGPVAYPAVGGQMNKTTLQRNTNAVFEEAYKHAEAIVPELCVRALTSSAARGGIVNPQILRNSYVAQLFRNGSSTESVAKHMGFAEVVIAVRIWRSWMQWRAKYETSAFIAWVTNNPWDYHLHQSLIQALGDLEHSEYFSGDFTDKIYSILESGGTPRAATG